LCIYYGPEYLSEIITQWAGTHGIALNYIQPGKPQQNAYVERFNRTAHSAGRIKFVMLNSVIGLHIVSLAKNVIFEAVSF
jgi:transposase InsO family protein